ncbi:MAG: hypothetical protein AAB906_04035 [Patescibacteria group bacterium]
MITLNLISQELKDEIKLKHAYGLLKKIIYILFLILIVSSSCLLAAEFVLQNNFNRIVGETSLITKSTQSYNQKVREINAKFASVSQIQSEYAPWSLLLEELIAKTPGDISFSFVKINRDDSSIKIVGNAKTRAGLLEFKDNIEKAGMFKNADFPLKNMLQKENISFEIKLNFNMDELTLKIAQNR